MIYIFHTGEDWFPAELKCNLDAIAMAELNPDVIKVKDMYRIIIWEKKQ